MRGMSHQRERMPNVGKCRNCSRGSRRFDVGRVVDARGEPAKMQLAMSHRQA